MNPPLSTLLGTFAVFTQLAPAQDFETLRASAAAEAVPKLAALAEWCQTVKLYRECVRTYEAILRLDPKHSKARQVLRYSRLRDGSWKQDPGFREPINAEESQLLEYSVRCADIVGPYCEKIFDALQECSETVPPEVRELTLRNLLALEPKNQRTRLAWLQCRRSKAVNAEDAPLLIAALKDFEESAKAAVEAVKEPEKTRIYATEEKSGLPFLGAVATDHVRVLTTGDPSEAEDAARRAEAAGPLFHRAFGVPPIFRTDYTVYLLVGAGEKEVFLEKFPGISPAHKKLAEVVSGVWAGASGVADWSPTRDRRVDGAVRQTIAIMMLDAFRIGTKTGWAEEGFGLYLTYLLTRTRLTWIVKPSRYAQQGPTLRQKLAQPNADWFREARGLLEGKDKPAIERVMERDVNAMTDEDLLYGYALAAFLINSRPADTPDFLRALGSGSIPAVAVNDHLGLALPELEKRLIEWLKFVAP
jgi:hypothetical protein